MESKNYKIIENFINDSEVNEIINWTKTLIHFEKKSNFHLTEISKSLNGNSFIFDISNNKITNYITDFQSIGQVIYDKPPIFFI